MTTDMPQHEHPIDAALWVELTDSDVRWYVCGNPHTFPGRFDVWSPDLDIALTVSKDEVIAMSEPARWWIEGFLHGNEPSIYEFLELDPATAEIDDDDPAWARWRVALAEFRRTGATPRDKLLSRQAPTDET